MNIQQLSEQQVQDVREQSTTFHGFPLFNPCPHTFIDLSGPNEDPAATPIMQTLSVKLPNGEYVTFSVISQERIEAGAGCIDIKYHGNGKTRVIAFTPNGQPDQQAKTDMLYTFMYSNKRR